MQNLKFSKSKLFLFFCLVFIASIFFGSFCPENLIKHDLIWFGATIISLVVFTSFYLFFSGYKFFNLTKLFLFSLTVFLFALWRYSIAIPLVTPELIQFYNGEKVDIIGTIAEDPDVRQNQVKYLFEASYLNKLNQPVSGQILITNGLYPEYKFGDQLLVSCGLEAPKPVKDFAYDRYLARIDIYSICYQPKIKILRLATTSENGYYAGILNFKDKLRGIMNLGLTEPEASLARGMILGDQRGLPDDIKQQFAKTGLSHIIAISGMNFTFIVVMLTSLLLAIGFRRQQVFYLVSFVIFFYVILIGLPASAVRAVIMSFLFLLALYLGRLSKLTNLLIFAAVIMTLLNPKLLRDDVGFQLSFFALLGIIYVYPIFNYYSAKLNFLKSKGVSEVINLTLAAQVFTLPIMASSFQAISLIAPISNLFVLWTLPVVTVLLVVALLLGWLLPVFSLAIFWPTQILLNYIIFAVRQFSLIPYAQLPVNQWGAVLICSYYFFTAWLVLKLQKKLYNNE